MEIDKFDESFYDNDDVVFTGAFVSVVDVINKVITVRGVGTKVIKGEVKTIIYFTDERGEDSAFITGSHYLSSAVLDRNRTFPFQTVIKVKDLGNATAFKFYSPDTEISADDVRHYQDFIRNQDYTNRPKKNRR